MANKLILTGTGETDVMFWDEKAKAIVAIKDGQRGVVASETPGHPVDWKQFAFGGFRWNMFRIVGPDGAPYPDFDGKTIPAMKMTNMKDGEPVYQVTGGKAQTSDEREAAAFAEAMERHYQTLERKIGAHERIDAEKVKQAHVATVDAFCERMLSERKVHAAEVDSKATVPNLRSRLLRADGLHRVHVFSEAGRIGFKTELELQMAEIEARGPLPPVAPTPVPLTAERRAELLKASPLGAAALKADGKA